MGENMKKSEKKKLRRTDRRKLELEHMNKRAKNNKKIQPAIFFLFIVASYKKRTKKQTP